MSKDSSNTVSDSLPNPDEENSSTESQASEIYRRAAERASRRHRVPTAREFVEAIQIENKDIGGLAPFKLWPQQAEVLDVLQEHERVIVCKARQLGLTWLCLAHALWEATFWGHRLFLLASKREDEGKELLRRLRLMHASLPKDWRAPVKTGDDSKLSMSFANGSRFLVLPPTQSMARSYAAYAVFIDEMAFMPYQQELWGAVKPAARRIRIVSTGYRKTDVYYDLWTQANNGTNEFFPVFLPWWVDPSRDEAWYQQEVKNAVRVRIAQREFASTPDEAFTSAEGLVFERFHRDLHVAEFPVDRGSRLVRAVDFGYRHAACLWLVVAPDNQIKVVHELILLEKTTGEFAAAIHAEDQRLFDLYDLTPMVSYCDPAGMAKNTQTGMSDIEIFQAAGLSPVTKPASFLDGCNLIQHSLVSKRPLIIHPNCRELITSFESLEPDPNAPNVYAKEGMYEHVMDAFRYGMVNVAMGIAGHFTDVGVTARTDYAPPTTAGLYSKLF